MENRWREGINEIAYVDVAPMLIDAAAKFNRPRKNPAASALCKNVAKQ